MQISLGLPDPRDQTSLLILKWVMAGISRARVQGGSQTRIRLPITIQVLLRIHEVCPGLPSSVRDVPCICVHYTLSPSHTLIPSLLSYYYPRDSYGNPGHHVLSSAQEQVLWAIAATAFFGFFRLGNSYQSHCQQSIPPPNCHGGTWRLIVILLRQ